MKLSPWLMAASALFLVACSNSADRQSEPEQRATAVHIPQQRINQRSQAHCEGLGGSMTFAQQLDGSSIGMCQLANGKRVPSQF